MVSFTDPKILQLNGFTMRPIQASDLDALVTIWADPEVTRFLPSRGVPIARENAAKSLQSFTLHWQRRGYGIWTILEDTSSHMIGYCGLRYLDELDEVEVLYGLARTYWGRGIITQAVKASITYGFNIANLDRIVAIALPENIASRRVMEKSGLCYEKQICIFGLDGLYHSIERCTM